MKLEKKAANVLCAVWTSCLMIQGCGGVEGESQQKPAAAVVITGSDSIDIEGPSDDFLIAKSSQGYVVTDKKSGRVTQYAGTVLRMHFTEASLAFDQDGHAGQALRLYKAAFNRAPDAEGLGYWIDYLDRGAPLTDAAIGFFGSAEFKALYGLDTTNEVLIERLYQNVLSRQPDTTGMHWWLDQLKSGAQTKPVALIGFSESPENRLQTSALVAGGMKYKRRSSQAIAQPPAGWNFGFSENVPSSDRATFVDGFVKADAFFRSVFSTSAPSFDAYFVVGRPALKAAYLKAFPSATEGAAESLAARGEGTVALTHFQELGASGWAPLSQTYRLVIQGHSYAHLVHNTLMQGNYRYPVWMAEGFATYFEYMAREAYGDSSYAYSRASAYSRAQVISTLKSLETREVMDRNPSGGYALGFFAMEYIASISPQGRSALIDIWRDIGAGFRWEDAIERSTGKSLETFYRDFEIWRTENRPPRLAGVVTRASGAASGIFVVACMRGTLWPRQCESGLSTTTDSNGTFSLTLPENTTYSLFFLSGASGPIIGYYTGQQTPLSTDANSAARILLKGDDGSIQAAM